jgi:adenosylcobinamide kinase/adenosylcobinamide-phosphate guanylyltransferase
MSVSGRTYPAYVERNTIGETPSMQPGLTLVLGGARAGKSAFAERLAARHGPHVLYVATAEPLDDDMRARIAAHRAARPPAWRTVEAPLDPAAALHAVTGPVDAALLDCLTLWTSNLMLRAPGPADAERGAADALTALLDWQRAMGIPLYIVSNEVGLGVVPPTSLGRAFQDVLGRLNQRVAATAEQVYLVVAGLALDLRALGATVIDAPPEPAVE